MNARALLVLCLLGALFTLEADGQVGTYIGLPSSGSTIGTSVNSGTAKSVLYIDASGNLAQDPTNFAWDGVNHRLGLGVASPLWPLDINRPATAASGQGQVVSTVGLVTASADNDALIGMYISPTFANAGKANVTHAGLVVNSGNVGIGTISPARQLVVDGGTGDVSTGGLASMQIQNTSTNYGPQFRLSNTSANTFGHTYIFVSTQTADSPGAGSFIIVDSVAATPRLTIDGTGKMGINTQTPQATLDINGYMRMAKYAFGSPPIACDAGHDGLIFLSTTYHTCVCKGGSTAYVLTSDGASACS